MAVDSRNEERGVSLMSKAAQKNTDQMFEVTFNIHPRKISVVSFFSFILYLFAFLSGRIMWRDYKQRSLLVVVYTKCPNEGLLTS